MLKNLTINKSKLLATIVVIGYFAYCALHQETWHIIDSVDLIFHEAGHPIMSIFGEFMSILGGSLFQLLIPFVLIGYFFLRLEYFSASILLAWLGYSLVNLSKYIGDAIMMQLELLGGDGVIHDWNYLLSNTGLLAHTYQIASVAYGFGMLFIVVSAVLAIRFSFDKKAVSLY